jgi:nucleotide-binding universal stress UspA family protein
LALVRADVAPENGAPRRAAQAVRKSTWFPRESEWHALCTAKVEEVHMTSHRKPYTVVVGIDFESVGDLALESAFRAAAAHPDGEVHAVHVAPAIGSELYMEGPGEVRLVSMEEAALCLKKHVETRLTEFTKSAAASFARVVTHVRVDQKAQEIAQLASDLEADLLVVGTHGRRGVNRVLMGSVAELAVRLAPCPVLVVRPLQTPSVLQIEPPCPLCVNTRLESRGAKFWCPQHSERHARRHTYHFADRTNHQREALPGLGSND